MITANEAEFLMTLYFVVSALCRGLTMVLGLVVTFRKRRALRELGRFLFLSGLFNSWNLMNMFLVRISERMAVMMSYASFIVTILSFVTYVMFFLYARKKYKAKGIIFVSVFPLAWFIVFRVVTAFVINRVTVDEVALVAMIFDVLINIAPFIIWVFMTIVFHSNKEKEDIAPKLYVWCLMFAIFIAASKFFDVFSSNLPNIINLMAALILSMIYPAFGIYLNVCLSRYSKRKKEV